MSSELLEISLKDAVQFIVDNRGKTAPTVENGVALIATNCVNNKDLYPQKLNLRYVSQDTYENWFRAHPKAGDILLTNKGSQNGAICLVPDPVDFCIAQDMVALRADPKKIEPLYLFAALRSEVVQQRIKALNVDAVIPHLKKTDFDKLFIPMPDAVTQKWIGDWYFQMCSRIELLRETNQTLEAIAQAMFKSWFVDFDPVRAKVEGKLPEGIDAASAALFPDAFEESDLGLVPRGWVIGRLIDFAKLKGGKILSKEYFSVDAEFPVYGGAGEMGRSNLFNAEGFVITVGRVGAYCGQYFWHLGKAWVNNNASHVIPHNVNYSVWLYQWLRSVDMDLIKKGAAQPFVSNGDIENLQIILPAASVIEEFVSVCEPLFERMSSVLASISTLTNLRDTLLPRLISGQLRIADAEEELEKAIA